MSKQTVEQLEKELETLRAIAVKPKATQTSTSNDLATHPITDAERAEYAKAVKDGYTPSSMSPDEDTSPEAVLKNFVMLNRLLKKLAVQK